MSEEPAESGGGRAPGTVVWVKLGSCWWPGCVVEQAAAPPAALRSLRKTPIAIVQFFQEDSFEFVRNEDFIFDYNCSRKADFIKKGLDMYRAKHTHMLKFPEDVIRAEELTDGDVQILTRPEYQQEERRSYAGLFGESTPRNTPARTRGRASTSRQSTSRVTPSPIKKKTNTPSNYKVHILVQGSSTPGVPPPSPASAPPQPGTSPAPGSYKCHACSFSANRLNVMILHTKTHSGTYTPYVPTPKKNITKSPKKVSPKKTNKQRKSNKRAAEPSPPVEAKKSKSIVEIKNTLLADWEDGDDSSMDAPLATVAAADRSEAVPSPTSPVASSSAALAPPPIAQDPITDVPNASKTNDTKHEADNVDVETSCFDFREDDELMVDPGKKIPRMKRAEVASALDGTEEVAHEVDELLEATAMPELPSAPPQLKFQENFPPVEKAKSPDKPTETPHKVIFKTKTFFRSRHSRGQDAIEKYVAEQLNAAERHDTESPEPSPVSEDKPARLDAESPEPRPVNQIVSKAQQHDLESPEPLSVSEQKPSRAAPSAQQDDSDSPEPSSVSEHMPVQLAPKVQQLDAELLEPPTVSEHVPLQLAPKAQRHDSESPEPLSVSEHKPTRLAPKAQRHDAESPVPPPISEHKPRLAPKMELKKLKAETRERREEGDNSPREASVSPVERASAAAAAAQEEAAVRRSLGDSLLGVCKDMTQHIGDDPPEELLEDDVPSDRINGRPDAHLSDLNGSYGRTYSAFCTANIELPSKPADCEEDSFLNKVSEQQKNQRRNSEEKSVHRSNFEDQKPGQNLEEEKFLQTPTNDDEISQHSKISVEMQSIHSENFEEVKSSGEMSLHSVNFPEEAKHNKHIEETQDHVPPVLVEPQRQTSQLKSCGNGESEKDTQLNEVVIEESKLPQNDSFEEKTIKNNDKEPELLPIKDRVSRVMEQNFLTNFSLDTEDVVAAKSKDDNKTASVEGCETDTVTESDLQIARTLISLPGLHATAPPEAVDATPHVVSDRTQWGTDNLHAAQSLVEMSESCDPHITTPDLPTTTLENQISLLTDAKPLSPAPEVSEPSPVKTTYENSTSKLLQILEEPPKAKPLIKMFSPKRLPMANEKILNFNVISTPGKAPPSPAKQKIIIRRSGALGKNSLNTLMDTPQDKIILSRSTAAPSRDGVSTYTIESPPESKQTAPIRSESNTIIIQQKARKSINAPPKLQKIKPQTAPVTSHPPLTVPPPPSTTAPPVPPLDDSIFDINSMPIVLSDDLLTPESIERMPIVMSDGTTSVAPVPPASLPVLTPAPQAPPKPVPKSFAPVPGVSAPMTEATSKSDMKFLVTSAGEKPTTPNILTKPSKRITKPMFVVDKVTGEKKIIMTKTDPTSKEIKITTSVAGVQHSPGKGDKFIILPAGGAVPRPARHKIVIGPQPSKVLVGKPASEQRLSTPANKPPDAAPPGGTVMIITNAQGAQSRIVLTPQHEKLLFPNKGLTPVKSAPRPIAPTASKPQIIVTTIAPPPVRAVAKPQPVPKPVKSIPLGKPQLITKPQQVTKPQLITKPQQVTKPQLITRPQQVAKSQPRIISKQKQQQHAIITSKGQLIVAGSPKPTTVVSAQSEVRPQTPLRTFQPAASKILRAAAPVAQPKEPVIILQQKSGAIMQLTAAQFEHLQRTGQIVQKTVPKPAMLKQVGSAQRPPEELSHKPKTKSIRPTLSSPAAKKPRLQEKPTIELPVPPLAQTASTATTAPVLAAPPVPAAPTAPPPIPHNNLSDLDNLEELLPSTAIARPAPAPAPAPAPEQAAPPQPAPAIPDNQLLAVPGENFGGPPNTFYLCVEENGTLTPIDNRPLVLDNNQLVPMAEEPAPRDILAAALANTDVFAPREEVPQPAPDFRDLNANVSVHCRVSETSITLNQPIMTPLEVPSGKPEPVAATLEDGLAVIGATASAVPTSLHLPMTVTDPRYTHPAASAISMPLLSEEDDAGSKSMPILTEEAAAACAHMPADAWPSPPPLPSAAPAHHL